MGIGPGSGGVGRPADGWDCVDVVVALLCAPPRGDIGASDTWVLAQVCLAPALRLEVVIGIEKTQLDASEACVSAERQRVSMSPAARVQHMQPCHTDFIHAEHKVELREPLPALPATCMGSASHQVPGTGLGSAQPALCRPRWCVSVSIGTWARCQQELPPRWTRSYLVSLKLTWLFVYLVLSVTHRGWKQKITGLLYCPEDASLFLMVFFLSDDVCPPCLIISLTVYHSLPVLPYICVSHLPCAQRVLGLPSKTVGPAVKRVMLWGG